jgi:hypothetical protein
MQTSQDRTPPPDFKGSPHVVCARLVSRKQPEYDNATPTPSYIPLESGIKEGYKRLEINDPALRLPQNSSTQNCCTTCKMTYFTHPDTCSPFLEPTTW